ncbi:EPIDERMAL PATTERNING FACTOR-like protein 2 [Typha angustifolia]|uniref:EPIDERMAL PATTERNING FACTOR-like protein 2 n=1 Tax=Typha angustifolia TaxID=59011 RepID=UPI003C2B628A
MGHLLKCINTFSMLLLLSSTQVVYSSGGRSLLPLLELAKDRGDKIAVRALIGSRPPRCEGRCMSCGHCEAVQVPIVPQLRIGVKHIFATLAYRVDDHSNYKPLSWKCKCGNLIFDP